VQEKLIAGIHRAFICPVVVTVVRRSICCDQDCILVIDYLPKGQTVNAEFYPSLLVQMTDILKVIAITENTLDGENYDFFGWLTNFEKGVRSV
jgi:hypothetical protein